MNNKQSSSGHNNVIFNVQGSSNVNINYPFTNPNPIKVIEPEYVIEKIKEEPFKIFNQHFKNSWLLISSAVTFLADIISVITAGGIFNVRNSFMPLLGLAMMFLMIFGVFHFQKFLSFSKWTVLNKQGKLYFTKYAGTCPHCSGKLSVGQSKEQGLFVYCSNYPQQHRAAFNPLIFEKRL